MPGHITKRSKDSWTVVIDVSRDPATGKRRQISRANKGTKKDAEKLLTRLLHDRDIGVDGMPSKQTTAEYLRQWLSDYVEPKRAPRTLSRYEEIVRLHLSPLIGRVPLVKLRPLQIQACYKSLLAKGLSPTTVLQCHRVLRKALKSAKKWQLIAMNPADSAEPPSVAWSEITALSPDAVRLIFDAADRTQYGDIVYLAVMTGLRRGELLGLRWQDIDLDGGVLCVRNAVQRLPGQGIVVCPTKTHRSARPVAISPDTIERLRARRVAQIEERPVAGEAYEDHDLVFATPLGSPIDPANLRRAWTTITSAAGVGHVRFLDLRHAHATLLMQQGVHPKIVSERLGHAGIAITLDTYSHVLPGLQAEAASKLDKLLAPAPSLA